MFAGGGRLVLRSFSLPGGGYSTVLTVHVCERGPYSLTGLTQSDRWLLVGIQMSLALAEEGLPAVALL